GRRFGPLPGHHGIANRRARAREEQPRDDDQSPAHEIGVSRYRRLNATAAMSNATIRPPVNRRTAVCTLHHVQSAPNSTDATSRARLTSVVSTAMPVVRSSAGRTALAIAMST